LANIELNKNDWTMLAEDCAAWRGRVRKLCWILFKLLYLHWDLGPLKVRPGTFPMLREGIPQNIKESICLRKMEKESAKLQQWSWL
jgi:hypothetical protein